MLSYGDNFKQIAILSSFLESRLIFPFLSGSVASSLSENRISVLLSPICVTSELTKAIIYPETWILFSPQHLGFCWQKWRFNKSGFSTNENRIARTVAKETSVPKFDWTVSLKRWNGIFGKECWGEAAYVNETRYDHIKIQTNIQWCYTRDMADNANSKTDLKKNLELWYTTKKMQTLKTLGGKKHLQ